MTDELWKEIELGSAYWVSNLGRVKHNKILLVQVQSKDIRGKYITIEGKNIFVHQLVAAIFIYNDLSLCGYMDIDFIDGSPLNCALSNLYLRGSREIYLVEEAADVCSTTKEMLRYLKDRGVKISARELYEIKKRHGIRCGESRPGTITYNGRTQTPEAWAYEAGIHIATLRKRIQRGWPLEKALGIPVQHHKRFRIH